MSGVDWSQFPINVTFVEPGQHVTGVLGSVRAVKRHDGVVVPELHLRGDDGTPLIILATQADLRRALHDTAPKIGDRIRITFTGVSGRAAPGMNPTKQFKVDIAKAATS